MGFAPELPTTEILQAMHPLSNEGRQKVYEKRKEVAAALKFGHKLLVIMGPCAMTGDEAAILNENRQLAEFAEQKNMVILHRLPPWKPRTNPADWHGHETTSPEEAHRLTVAIAEQNGNLAMEFGHLAHIRRYIGQTALGWRGSRNDQKGELLRELVQHDQAVPIAIKNGMNGSTEAAIHEAELASSERTQPDAAPVVMIFRGGTDLRTPELWLTEHDRALRVTNGRFIVDVAHGGEQAHDPAGKFGKSVLGQLACLNSIIRAAEATGRLPHGVMIESSNLESPTDPVILLDTTFEVLEKLASIHRHATI